MTLPLSRAETELAALYQRVPGVPCACCGECCVSPTCTFLEFLLLMKSFVHVYPPERVAERLLLAPEIHPAYDGNLYCRFQENRCGLCLVHSGRTLACRLFGHLAINALGVKELENCRRMPPLSEEVLRPEQVRTFLADLTDLNRRLVPSYYEEPYWVMGLNIECWLAVYFDPLLDDQVFGEMKRLLRQTIDLSFLEDRYHDTTGLKEKVDKIALLYGLIQTDFLSDAHRLIDDIRNHYPQTGTYYLEELEKIAFLVRSNSGKQDI
ncbi:MAG: hypothetical protein A2293_08460 [Elusimicrobia bacterium RIFOXYB2_FULL_49_7]|nr:MAG: hypothetical protein A2293_08460 [Elusimicrobia bacterium RIFOXYB2_FULL_49_7]